MLLNDKNMVVAHKIIIRNASLKGQSVDLHITGNRISRIVPHLQEVAFCPETNDITYIDAQGMNVFPMFASNATHTVRFYAGILYWAFSFPVAVTTA